MQFTNLTTNFLGRDVSFYHEIDSTQNEIWRRIENHTSVNGSVVIADLQTQGKGTHGRIWHTDEPNNISFSLYIQTECTPEKLEGITVEIAQILVDILKKEYGIGLEIKEPNDIMYHQKKIGGILTESKVHLETVKFLVIGIGINTNKMNFTSDIENIATSIQKEFGIEVDRNKVITEFCNQFEAVMERRTKR